MFWILFAALLVTNFLDYRSTFIALRTNPQAKEANVLIRWAVRRGERFMQLFTGALNALIGVACAILKSNGYWHTAIWWLPLAGCAALHGFLAWRNRRYFGR